MLGNRLNFKMRQFSAIEHANIYQQQQTCVGPKNANKPYKSITRFQTTKWWKPFSQKRIFDVKDFSFKKRVLQVKHMNLFVQYLLNGNIYWKNICVIKSNVSNRANFEGQGNY